MSSNMLIVRLSAVGDAVHGLPVLCALQDFIPRARLTWLVEERAAAVVRGHSALDRLITVPRGWLRSPTALWRVRRGFIRRGAEIAPDLPSFSKKAVAALLSGAAGFAARRPCGGCGEIYAACGRKSPSTCKV